MRATGHTILLIAVLLMLPLWSLGQGVGINTAGAIPDASAMLDLSATNRGLLTPRMTKAQRDAIAGPATGLLIFQTDEQPGFRFFDGTDWVFLRGRNTLPGAMDISGGCATSVSAPAGSGVVGAYNCATGNGSFTWIGGVFDHPPAVNISSSVVPVPPPSPDIYCIPQYAAPCNTFLNADPITGVRIYWNNGSGGPANTVIMQRQTSGAVLTGCDDPGNGNYYAVPVFPSTTATLSGNVGGGACSGNFYRIELRAGVEWPDGVQAWIDWNADGDFLDAQEHIPVTPIFGQSQGNYISSQQFSVPNFALNGNTVMRCRSIYMPTEAGNANNPCQGGTYGEVEDYSLTIDCATSGPSPEVPSYCLITDVTVNSFDFTCRLLSGAPIAPPKVYFELIPVE